MAFSEMFSHQILYGFLSPFLSRTISALRLPTFYGLHSNKTSNSFSVFTLFAHFVIVISVHTVSHVFAFCPIFRVEELPPFNPLKPELYPICYLLALLAHHFLHVSRIRVKLLTFRLLMSYIYIYIYIYIWSTHS